MATENKRKIFIYEKWIGCIAQSLSPAIRHLSSLTYLSTAIFCGAMNDNMFKLLVVFFFIQQEGIEVSHVILATTGAIFVIPFLFFSSTAGILADRFSKRNIIIFTKVLELLILCLGMFAFAWPSKTLAYLALFLLATHSTLFSPSKYGILPELLPSEKISQANGVITSLTYLAIILGTFFASFILDVTNKNFIIAIYCCLGVAIIGCISSFCIEYTLPAGSRKKLEIHFVSDIYKTLLAVRKEPSLLAAILGSAFFLFLGAYVQLNMIPFAAQSLGLTDVQGGYLFLLTALGIGTGSIVAGKISGKKVELALPPFAAAGITWSFYSLSLYGVTHFWACILLIVIIGVFGGIYLVPLDAHIQVASPKKMIGQVVAATTFLSFLGVLLASSMLYLITEFFGLKAEDGFAILGTITFGITLAYTYLFFDYITRFVGMILSRLHFSIDFEGSNKIPDLPSLYVCTHTAWNDTLLLLGSQRRRLRFFIEEEQEHTNRWLKKLYRLLRVVVINPIEPLEDNEACFLQIKDLLQRGISVCIFVADPNIELQFEKLRYAQLVRKVMYETGCPLVAVHIEKGVQPPRLFRRLMQKIHVPAKVIFKDPLWNRQIAG